MRSLFFESFPLFSRVALSLILLAVSSGGCSHLKPQKKQEPGIAEKISADIASGRTLVVGDYTTSSNLHALEVRGVALVQGLPGTGSDDVNSLERRLVYDEMLKIGVHNPRAVLASPTTAVVNIVGYMRAGIQEDDLFDVKLMLPEESDAKSLRGGWVMKSPLKIMSVIDNSLKEGRAYAYIEGPLLVDDPLASLTDNPTGLKGGVVLSGARSKITRPIYLHLKKDYESEFIADKIAKEINNRFYISSGHKKGMATAKSDSLIVLDVHPHYRNNVIRYVQIIRSISCYETPQKQLLRIERLKEELRIPEKSQRASFQLEAIGKGGIEALKSALTSDITEVQFHAACALAFLENDASVPYLVRLAKEEPAFRVYALDALSMLKSSIDAELALQELLHASSAETRYGAFRALCYRNAFDRTIRGEVLRNEAGPQFSFHGITSTAPPLVHLTKSSRPELVLFGNNIQFKRPFTLSAGPTIFVNGQEQDVVITKFGRLDTKRTVPNRIENIVRAVVELGGTYPDVMQMLCEADRDKVLSCRLEMDCLPEEMRIYRRPGGNYVEDIDDEEETKKRGFWDRMNPKTWFESNPGQRSSDHKDETPNRSERG